ncbi:hypothetical protein ACNH6C_02005 [Bdellovibrio bacteriovorus]|uniref:hypothetical protein n=1 Tax=Bdellovibrio bacteriovorus TaxID=959 RepID=UPI003A807ED1
MSMLNSIRAAFIVPVIALTGACSFQKNKNEKQPVIVEEKSNTPTFFCQGAIPDDSLPDSQLLAFSTSNKEDELCQAIIQFRQKSSKGLLISKDKEIFNNILKSTLTIVKTRNVDHNSKDFSDFSLWASQFTAANEGTSHQTMIRINNLISSQQNNILLANRDFVARKVFLFVDTDHLSQDDYLTYFEALANKVTLSELCSDQSLRILLRSKKISAHTLSTLQRCRAVYSAADIVQLRSTLSTPVSEDEVNLLSTLLRNNFITPSLEEINFSVIGAPISLAVKNNDLNLLKLSIIAFEKSGKVFSSLIMAKRMKYDLEGFLRTNAKSLHSTLSSLWTPPEILNALKESESKAFFDILSESDAIPVRTQSEEILNSLWEARSKHSSFNIHGLASFLLLLRSNTVSGFNVLFSKLGLANKEIALIVKRMDSSAQVAELVGVPLSWGRIYLKTDSRDLPIFSATEKERYSLSGELFQAIFFPIEGEKHKEFEGVRYDYAENTSYFITEKDIFGTEISEMSTKIQCESSTPECPEPQQVIVDGLVAVAKFTQDQRAKSIRLLSLE